MSKLIVGIDFGTSTTVVRGCIEGDDNLYPIKHNDSSVIPTLIYITEDGRKLFGKDAESYIANSYKGKAVSNFKMGLASADMSKKEEAKGYIKEYLRFIYDLFVAQKHQFPAYREMKVRVSYPAKWTSDMAEFMINAVKEAGFGPNVDGMTEPEAASCYSLKKRMDELQRKGILRPNKKANVMMLDMGAGTSDISIFQVSVGKQGDIFLDGVLSYPSVSEANSCGGREIDAMLSAYICKRFNIPEKHFTPAMAKMWKENIVSPSLTNNAPVTQAPSNVEMILSVLGNDDKLNGFVFSRTQFEAETTAHWENLYRIICDAFNQYRNAPATPNIGPEDIDLVLITGGHAKWYCVDELILGRGVNGYIGTGKVGKALNFAKIKQDPSRIIREALPHETVADGMCLRDTAVKIEALSSNNVWGQLFLNDAPGNMVALFNAGEKLPASKTVQFSATTRKRMIDEYFDLRLELFYGDNENKVKESSRIVFDGREIVSDIFLALIGIGFIKSNYKMVLNTTVSLDENGVMDFHGEAVLYEDEKEKQRFQFSKGDSKSIGLYGDQKEKDI